MSNRDLYFSYNFTPPIESISLANTFELFLQQVNDLAVFPARYPLARDEILAAWGIRFLRIKNYIAFYLIDDAREMIYVIRFLYGKSNWASILKNSIAN